MEALKNVINFLSLPQYSFPLSLVLFFLMLRSKGVSARILPFIVQLSATPPARHRSDNPVFSTICRSRARTRSSSSACSVAAML